MNKVILMGRLTKDPELRTTPSGVSVANFSIAVNRRFAKEGQQQADFINCVAWKGTAEHIKRWFVKGSMIAVVGSIQTRSWDGQDGKRQYATEVVVDEAYFTGEKRESGTYNQTPPADKFSQIPSGGFDDFEDINLDDGPFPWEQGGRKWQG